MKQDTGDTIQDTRYKIHDPGLENLIDFVMGADVKEMDGIGGEFKDDSQIMRQRTGI